MRGETEQEKPRLWFISGLGADRSVFERLFGHLTLLGFDCRFVDWIAPQPKEALEHYAVRLRQTISDTQPIIVGLSFGGMLAVEMAKQTVVERIILLSSVRTYKEIPWYLRVVGKLSLQNILPNTMFTKAHPFTYWYVGMKTPEEKHLLREILRNNNAHFMRWALGAIMRWRNETIPEQIAHIHGSADHLLPLRYVGSGKEYVHSVANGGHFMVWKNAELISPILATSCLPDLLNHYGSKNTKVLGY